MKFQKIFNRIENLWFDCFNDVNQGQSKYAQQVVDMGFWEFIDLLENIWDGEFRMLVYLHKKSFYLFYTFHEALLIAISRNFRLLNIFAGNGDWRFFQNHLRLFLTGNFFDLLFGWLDIQSICGFDYLVLNLLEGFSRIDKLEKIPSLIVAVSNMFFGGLKDLSYLNSYVLFHILYCVDKFLLDFDKLKINFKDP